MNDAEHTARGPVRYLTIEEQGVFHRALRRSARLIHKARGPDGRNDIFEAPLDDPDPPHDPDPPPIECDCCGLPKLGCTLISTRYGLETIVCPDCRGWDDDDYHQMDRGDCLYHNRDRD